MRCLTASGLHTIVPMLSDSIETNPFSSNVVLSFVEMNFKEGNDPAK